MEAILKSKLKHGKFIGVSLSRSRIMSSIKGKSNITTERTLRLALVREGIAGWKLHRKDIPGSPDFYFPHWLLAVFVDGCFWHGCPKCGHIPRIRRSFWQTKISRNRLRDRRTRSRLLRQGIRVMRFWEHDLRDSKGLDRVVAKLRTAVNQSSLSS